MFKCTIIAGRDIFSHLYLEIDFWSRLANVCHAAAGISVWSCGLYVNAPHYQYAFSTPYNRSCIISINFYKRTLLGWWFPLIVSPVDQEIRLWIVSTTRKFYHSKPFQAPRQDELIDQSLCINSAFHLATSSRYFAFFQQLPGAPNGSFSFSPLVLLFAPLVPGVALAGALPSS